MAKDLGLIEPSYRGRKRLLRRELQESYVDGKDTIVVSRGFFEWREDTEPNNADNTFTFVACNGSTTTVTPSYAGILAFAANPFTIKAFCPI